MTAHVSHTDKPMTMLKHIDELRHRLFWSALFFIVGALIGYMIRQPLQDLLLNPINQPIYYTSPTGGFDFILKICLFFGFLVTIPVFTYHFLRFIAPALRRSLHRALIIIIAISSLLTIAGVGFAYLVSLPAALYFLSKFSNEQVQSLLSANEYLSFIMLYLGGFAVIFQLPLILLLINWIVPIKTVTLWKYQPYVLVGSFIIAALLTPTPDPLNQAIMAAPIIVLYELSVLIIWLINRKNRVVKD
jgi:sec-independent protein translocase protein TatC